MLAFLQVADEIGFNVRSFHHGLEAYKIRDILAQKDVSVSTWADWWGFKMEAYDGIPENAALLSKSGGKPVIHSDSSRGIQRLNQEAGKAYYAGRHANIDLTENEALRWITYNAAWTLGIEKEVGTWSRESGQILSSGTNTPSRFTQALSWSSSMALFDTMPPKRLLHGVTLCSVKRRQTNADSHPYT